MNSHNRTNSQSPSHPSSPRNTDHIVRVLGYCRVSTDMQVQRGRIFRSLPTFFEINMTFFSSIAVLVSLFDRVLLNYAICRARSVLHGPTTACCDAAARLSNIKLECWFAPNRSQAD